MKRNSYLYNAIHMLSGEGLYIVPEADGEPIDSIGVLLSNPDLIYDLTQDVDEFHLVMYNSSQEYIGWIFGTNCNDENEWLCDYTCGPKSFPFSDLLDHLEY